MREKMVAYYKLTLNIDTDTDPDLWYEYDLADPELNRKILFS